jgi:hypothetical protein
MSKVTPRQALEAHPRLFVILSLSTIPEEWLERTSEPD